MSESGGVKFQILGNQVLLDGQPCGYISDGNSEDGYGLIVNGRRYECDAPDANGFVRAVAAD